MGDLSPNFSSKEFACRHCKLVHVDPALVDGLQALSDKTFELYNKRMAVHILSAYRCIQHNRKIGGSQNSLHTMGKAADIQIDGLTVEQTLKIAEMIPEFANGGIGIYPQEHFVHVDVRPVKARWARVNGKYVSLEMGLKHV